MNISGRLLVKRALLPAFAGISFLLGGPAKAYEIAATIAPIAGIAAAITNGTDIKVNTLLPSGQAPEAVDPESNVASVAARANLVLMSDPKYETFLGDFSEEHPDKIVSMSASPGVRLVTKRSNHFYKMTPMGITVKPEDFADAHAKDYHLWLNPQYALATAKQLRDRLVRTFPDNVTLFDANYAAFAQQIALSERASLETLYPAQGQAYVAYQDDFQYLDRKFALHQTAIMKNGTAAASPSDDSAKPDTSTGLPEEDEKVLKHRIAAVNVRCLVYDTPEGEAPTKALAKDTGAQAVKINPFGDSDATPSASSYFTFLNGVTSQFARCLNGG